MDEVKVLKFVDLDVEKFQEYLIACDIQEIQIVDFGKNKIKCKAHPSDISFVKYTVVDTAEILSYKDLPEDFTLLKFPLHRIKKLRDSLGIYLKRGLTKINGEIGYTKEDDQTLCGVYFKMIVPKNNLRINATEMFLAKYMEDEHWEIYSERDNAIAKFDIDKDFITYINSLCNLEGDDNVDSKEKNISIKLDILSKEKKVVFKSKDKDKWSVEYSGNLVMNADRDYTFFIPQKVIKSMTAQLYDIYIVYNERISQYIMVMYEDDNNIMLKALMESE